MRSDSRATIRLDKALVELNLVRSRTRAQRLIHQGLVKVAGQIVYDVSALVAASVSQIEILAHDEDRYVSRGGLKLEKAIQVLLEKLKLTTLTELSTFPLLALDLGISTGGFTDCLLQSGVSHVWGVDVGHGQLAAKLVGNPQLTLLENMNARGDLPAEFRVRGVDPFPLFQIVTIDVSFISLKLILPSAWSTLQSGGVLIALVKPQFELGASALDKRGVVKDPILYQNLERTMKDWALAQSAELLAWIDSPIFGGDGNREFLLIVRK